MGQGRGGGILLVSIGRVRYTGCQFGLVSDRVLILIINYWVSILVEDQNL